MLIDGAVLPATPVLIPEVGRGRERPALRTIGGCRDVARRAAARRPTTLLLLLPPADAPHLWLPPSGNDTLLADFRGFGADELNHTIAGARTLGERVLAQSASVWQAARESALPEQALTALYFLRPAGVRRTLALQAPTSNGEGIERAAGALLAALSGEPEQTLVVATGNLSSRLFRGAPGGYDPSAPAFDERVVRLTEQGNLAELRAVTERERVSAGETLLSQIALLQELLDKAARAELLSYEAPFGEGYLTAWISTELPPV